MNESPKSSEDKVEAVIAYLRRKKGLSRTDAVAAALANGDLRKEEGGKLCIAKKGKR